MELNDCGKDKQGRKKGFNRQLGLLNLLFFTIKKTGQQACSEDSDQNIHYVFFKVGPLPVEPVGPVRNVKELNGFKNPQVLFDGKA